MDKRVLHQISSEVRIDDIEYISQVTKCLLEYHIPFDIITKILELSYESDCVNNRYWEYSRGCGSGGDNVLLTITSLGNVELIWKSMWMGGNNKYVKCTGKYHDICGRNGVTYGLIIINSIVKQSITGFTVSEQEKLDINELYFDFIQFDKRMKTEWGEDIPIGLYAGGGCYSSVLFNAFLTSNNMCNVKNNIQERELYMLYDGLKLGEMPENEYTKRINLYKNNGLIL